MHQLVEMRTDCVECTVLWLKLSEAATTYVKLVIAQKGVVAQRKCNPGDMAELREAAKDRKNARVACNRHDAMHAEERRSRGPSQRPATYQVLTAA